MDISNLMEFSIMEDEENQYMAPPLTQTPVVKNSILKPSNKENLIQLNTPIHKNLKVKFQTPQTGKRVTPNRYEQIRELDDKENWAERTTVVLKSDHEENVHNALVILSELINNCVDSGEARRNKAPDVQEESEALNSTLTLDDETNDQKETPSCNVPTDIKEVASSPSIPVKTGSYSIDYDNLDAVDPFKTSGGLACSPSAKPVEVKTNSPQKDDKNQDDNLFDINLEDVEIKLVEDADVTVVENKPLGEADVTVVEKKHSAEVDVTVIENKHSEDADVTVVENKPLEDADATILENKTCIEGKKTIVENTEFKGEDSMKTLDLESISDPFATKMQLANSPNITVQNSATEKNIIKENPFAALKTELGSPPMQDSCNPQNKDQNAEKDLSSTEQMASNIPTDNADENTVIKQSEVSNSPTIENEENPFATKSKVSNSPATNSEENPFNTKSKVPNSPTIPAEENPFATKSKVPNSPTIAAEENPFATKSKVPNSPTIAAEENPFATKSNVVNTPTKAEEKKPFATKSNVPNSPVVSDAALTKMPKSPANITVEKDASCLSEVDDSLTTNAEGKPCTGNSQSLTTEDNPFVTKTKVPNSPSQSGEESAFATKPTVSNSPIAAVSGENAFASKSKVPNSPCANNEENPFATKSKVPNSPATTVEENPFATKSKVPNSPSISAEENPFATKSKVPTSPMIAAEENPCATKSKVPTSPAIAAEENPFATKSKVPTSPTIAAEENPFATKSKVPTSPTIAAEENPFATKSKVPTSPTIAAEENPFATKSKVPTSPTIVAEENPFATKSKVPTSPTIADEENPFSTKSKVPNSPAKTTENDPFETKAKVPNSPTDSKTEENPFAAKSKIQNSPENKSAYADQLPTKSELSSSNKVQELKLKQATRREKVEKVLNDDPFSPKFPAGNVSQKTEGTFKQDGLDTFGIDEDQFKPATDVFNDTAAWDLLETFGSSSADSVTAFNRQSLYVKFDPLVDLPPDDPRRASMDFRRASIDFRRASMKLERLREINAEDSFLLLGTPPKTSSVRSVGVVPSAEAGVKRKPPKTPVQVLKKSAVDLLSDSPDLPSMNVDVNRLGEQAEGIKMNMADMQDSDNGIVEVLKYTDADLRKMQHAILMEVQGKILASEREYALLKQDHEKDMNLLKEQFKNELIAAEEKGKKNAKNFEDIMVILTEYEKTIDNLINENEKLKEDKETEVKKLKEKVEQLSSDEQSVESAFSDLHRRYEKMKTALQGYKTNEETLKKHIEECNTKLKTKEESLLTLKKDAETKLKKVLEDNETLKAELESESSKSKVVLKRKEMENQKLQNQLEQQAKEIAELTSLCDELMARVK